MKLMDITSVEARPAIRLIRQMRLWQKNGRQTETKVNNGKKQETKEKSKEKHVRPALRNTKPLSAKELEEEEARREAKRATETFISLVRKM